MENIKKYDLTSIESKVDFIKEIEKGNFEAKLELSSENDDLGKALIKMNKKIKESNEKINS